MTDPKPLTLIKNAINKLRSELKQMEVRTGIIVHQILSVTIQDLEEDFIKGTNNKFGEIMNNNNNNNNYEEVY